jgi:DNA-binding transcriptional ArsR family regulator
VDTADVEPRVIFVSSDALHPTIIYNCTIMYLYWEIEMGLPHPVPDDLAELIARRFRVLGEPMRIKLLDRLRQGEASVNDLAEILDSSQQNVSKHLAVLTEVGILGRRKEGTYAYYRIVDEGVFALCEQVCGSVQQQLRVLSEIVAGVRQ